MGRLVVVSFLSLDGVMQSVLSADEDTEGGFDQGGWVQPFMDDAIAAVMSETTTHAAAMLLGRKTYEAFARVWPYADASEPAVAAMNRMTKYVASSTMTSSSWMNTVVLGTDLPAHVGRITSDSDGDIVVFGSGELVQTLAEHDLVDRYVLLLFPIVLGSGKRLFREGMPTARLVLVDSRPTSTGVLVLTYEPARGRTGRSAGAVP